MDYLFEAYQGFGVSLYYSVAFSGLDYQIDRNCDGKADILY